MRCSQVKRRLSAFLDGELPESKRRLVSEHLRVCESCRLESEELMCVAELLHPLEELEVPPDFAAAVRERALQRDRTVPGSSFLERMKHVTVPAAATAAICLSVLGGTVLGRAIYQLRADRTSREETELVTFLGAGSFVNVSSGSLVSAYNGLLSTEGE
jgi:anti-sigma factor RsiW